MFFSVPFFLASLSDFFKETFAFYKKVYFLLSAQMVMWIATALNSSIIDRENLVKNNNYKFLVLVLIGVFVLLFMKTNLTLELLVFIHYTIIFIATLIQYHSLVKGGISFVNAKRVLIMVYILTTGYYFLK